MKERTDYIKGLDGVRGISAVLVMLTHMHLIGFGWVVMQTFFVLSGFLITRILLNMREKYAFGDYLKIFYFRRALRIFPIYYLVLVSIVAFAYFSGDRQEWIDQSPFAFLYVWNWFAISYDGDLVHYYEHLWSLAVEEQFYLVWPLLLFFARGERFWKVAIAIVVLGPFIRLATGLIWPHLDGVLDDMHKAIYQMSTTHLDAFATGALMCAVINHPLSRRFKPWHLILGLALAYIAGVFASSPGIMRHGPYNLPFTFGYPIHMPENWQYVWGYSVVNILSAGLLILVAQGRFLTSVFQNPLIKRMGVISYGSYILHLPLLHVALPYIWAMQEWVGHKYLGTWLAAPFFLLMVFLIAELSWRYYESKFLILKDSLFSRGASTLNNVASIPGNKETEDGMQKNKPENKISG